MWKSKEAEKEYCKKYYLDHKEEIKIKSNKNYEKNKDKINKRVSEYRKTRHGQSVLIAKKYNITYDKANELLNIKNCEICGDDKYMAVDHCHTCGEVRGRLYYRCNRAMGAFNDNVETLSEAIKYLKKHKHIK